MVANANRNPEAKCGRCGKTKDRCGPNGDGKGANGRPIRWTAGHIVDGQVDGALRLECSYCNYAAGAKVKAQQRREPKTADWW